MEYFLQEVARDVYQKYGASVSDVTLVFPNRRSGLFFRKYLAEMINNPVWSPEITTISDLMQQISGIQKADPLSLVFDLYEIFKKEKKTPETFDEFYLWGEMLLKDFDDIDKYLADASDVFRNLSELKSIEDHFSYLTEEQIAAIRQFWDTLVMPSYSPEQQDFVSVWRILNQVYRKLNDSLTDEGLGYEGAIYRRAVEKIQTASVDFQSPYVFVGFNALTPAERKLFKHLKQLKLASFYWDYDEFYMKPGHEAGYFIRRNIKEFPGEELDFKPAFNYEEPVQFIDASYDTAEAKVLDHLLSSEKDERKEPNKQAVILPEERLLLPALSALPDEMKEVNITMGYPVSVTPTFSFLQTLLSLQDNARSRDGKISFYYKDVMAVLNHQYLSVVKDEKVEEVIKEIRTRNKIYIPEDELKISPLLKGIFIYVEESHSVSDYLLENYYNFYRQLKQLVDEEDQPLQLELESIYQVYLSVKRMKEIFSVRSTRVKRETYWRILERILGNQTISFRGEPLAGLQIMGLLETRALDFEELVILSMNEGVFPKKDHANSFIPYNLRKGFGLPTFEYNDAIYAYYFYRLLQRAKKVKLVYNSTASGTQTGEMSRFLYQIKYGNSIPVEERTMISDIKVPGNKPVKVAKTEPVLDKLQKYDSLNGPGKTLSPSALIKYLRCPLQFYYRYVAEVREPDEIDENIDLPLFGNILHRALQFLYEPYTGKEVSAKDLKKLGENPDNIKAAIIRAYQKEYFKVDPGKDKTVQLSGENVLISEIIFNYIFQMLKAEQQFAPFMIHSLEQPYQADIDFQVNGTDRRVTLKGYIDRLDETSEGIRVIDYKTGKPESGFQDIPALFEENGNHAALQALLYARMYADQNQSEKTIIPGLYFLKNIYQKNFHYAIGSKQNPVVYGDYAKALETHLKEKLREIFDPEVTFDQTENGDICRNCPYASLCRKN